MLVDKVLSYIKSPSRNKVVIHQRQIEGIISLNIGFELAGSLAEKLNGKNLALVASSTLDSLVSKHSFNHDEYGHVIALKNLGILLEPALKLDFSSLLTKYSTGTTLFIHWDGEIDNNKLYFLSKQKGRQIDISNISHIVI